MAVPYLDHFLDSLETLPTDLQRNFTLMRDLDTKTEDLVTKINGAAEEYIQTVPDLSPDNKYQRFDQIHEMFEKAKVLSDDKVQLAMQTYEMVDKHIRRLDTELAKFDSDLKDKQLTGVGVGGGGHLSDASVGGDGGAGIGSAGNAVDESSTKKKGGRKGGAGAAADKLSKGFNPKNVIKSDSDSKGGGGGGGRKKLDKLNENVIIGSTSVAAVLPALMANSDIGLDMAVDPNEPTYCLCHQVSYGEMIGCDNADCPIEWFHFGCVGLTIKPKGKWFCPKCIVERKKK
ncbi:inhibitor of growth protein 5-like [Oppia nitens]|uniref:inhibitor of growth protein 5-like n=1 Tax=Oppia nitens TaxID=1686743 RepID=UPI0023DC4A38|nr:inhibitor of growth protein 5-like [Oppia nitens]